MKPSRVFWGTFFIVVGSLFLIKANIGAMVGGSALLKYWPLVIIALGLGLMIKHAAVRIALAAIAGLWLGWFIFYIASFGWLDDVTVRIEDDKMSDALLQEFVEPLPAELHSAHLYVQTPAGKFRMDTTAANLLEARIRSQIGRYKLERVSNDGEIELRLVNKSLGNNSSDHITLPRPGDVANRGIIALNVRPSWSMQFDIGAASDELDLRPFKLEKLDLSAGVSSVRLWLPVPDNEMRCKIKAGVATLRISVPETVGCEIRMDGGLTSKRFEGFQRMSDGLYRTDGFPTAARKIRMNIDAGVSTVRVDRY
jgi:hypothetical protein